MISGRESRNVGVGVGDSILKKKEKNSKKIFSNQFKFGKIHKIL